MYNVLRQFGYISSDKGNDDQGSNNSHAGTPLDNINGTATDLIGNFLDNFTVEKMYMQGWTFHMLITCIVSYAMYFGIGGLVHVGCFDSFCFSVNFVIHKLNSP